MNYIVDDIGAVVTAMQSDATLIAALTAGIPALNSNGYAVGMPYYMYGHRREIANRLLEMDEDRVLKYKKYPLVALRLDIPEEHEDGIIKFRLNIAIVMRTDQNWNAEERYPLVLKPVLYPLYESFLRNFKTAGLFMWEGDQSEPPHTKLDRPYWGIEEGEGNVANIFNDPLDAIELIDLRFSQNLRC